MYLEALAELQKLHDRVYKGEISWDEFKSKLDYLNKAIQLID